MAPERPASAPLAIVVMGVSGSGKSTVAAQLAESLGVPFLESDEYHAARNIEKMSAGVALEDSDRWPWLESLGLALGSTARQQGCVVSACSALKRSYRECLRNAAGVPLQFVFLRADSALVRERMSTRVTHFMPPSLLETQFATLEIPDDSEGALTLDSAAAVPSLVAAIRNAVKRRSRTHSI